MTHCTILSAFPDDDDSVDAPAESILGYPLDDDTDDAFWAAEPYEGDPKPLDFEEGWS